jgi:hypothetical protein
MNALQAAEWFALGFIAGALVIGLAMLYMLQGCVP